MKNAQTDLKSSRPLDRADYLQTGTSPERDECEHKFQTGLHLPSLLRNNACLTKRCKKNNNGRQENKLIKRFVIFVPVS